MKNLMMILLFCLTLPSVARSESSMEFYRDLARKPEATIEDAIHAVARAKGYRGMTDSWQELMYLYEDHGIRFRKDIAQLADRRLTKGNAAHMLMRSMGVKGWVMNRIFKGSQRYALREAVYLKLLPPDSTVHQRMSGGELLGFLSRILEHTRDGGGEP